LGAGTQFAEGSTADFAAGTLQPAIFVDVDMASRQRPADMQNSGFTWVPGGKPNTLFGK
jgi:hypothetical protein